MNNLLYLPSSPVNRFCATPGRRRQRGVSLLIALVALALMTVAGFSLLRSVDTGNVIAGNMAFRNVTVQAADLGIEAAAAYLNTTIEPSPDGDLPSGCAVATASTLGNCLYSARIQIEDADGVPMVDWSNTANIPTITSNGISYQYVIERMCNPDPLVNVTLTQSAKKTEAADKCATDLVQLGGSSSSGGYSGASSPAKTVGLRYRTTVRVIGPRNSISTVQAILER